MKKIIVLMLLTILITSNIIVNAYTINGVELPDNQDILNAINSSYVITCKKDNLLKIAYSNRAFELYYGQQNKFRQGDIGKPNYLFYNYDTQEITRPEYHYSVDNTFTYADQLLCNFTLGNYINTYSNQLKIAHGDRFTFKNVGVGPVNPDIEFRKSNMTDAITLVMTDAYGKFVEQQNIAINKATFTIKVMPGETRNVYFSFDDELARVDKENHYIEFKFLNQTYIQWEKYIPKYRITGGTTVNLRGIEIPNEIPYIKPNSTTEIIYKYEDNGNIVFKSEQISPNEKFYLQTNTNYIIKFIHEPTKTIYVESNFTLQDTQERISLESDESLKEQIISNGGSLIEESPQDHKFEINAYKDIKITNLKTKNAIGVGEIIQAYVMGNANSHLKIHGYGYNDEQIYKKFEYYLDGSNMGKPYAISISPQEFIVLEETNGTSLITIRAKFIKDTDFQVEYYPEYPFDGNIETTYQSTNPTPPNIGNVNDMYVQPVTDFWGSIVGGGTPDWTGINPDTSELTLAIGQVSNIKGFTEIFIQPVTYLFTGVPEIYAIIVFALGLSVVKFVLGR